MPGRSSRPDDLGRRPDTALAAAALFGVAVVMLLAMLTERRRFWRVEEALAGAVALAAGALVARRGRRAWIRWAAMAALILSHLAHGRAQRLAPGQRRRRGRLWRLFRRGACPATDPARR